MKKTTRTLALVMALLMMVALFAGCNSGSPETPAPETEAPVTEAPVETTPDEPNGAATDEATHPYPISLPITEEPVEFKLWTTINPMATTYVEQLTDTAVYSYINEITNVYCVAESISAMQARDQFPLMVNSGDWPDVVERVSELYVGGMNNAYLEEFIIDITAAVQEFSPNYYSRLEENPIRMLGATGGTGEEILTYAEIWDDFESISSGLAIRQDWLEELSLEIPQTYGELEAVLQAFQSEKGATAAMWLSPYGTGGGTTLAGGYGIAMALDNMGGSQPFFVEDGVVKSGLNHQSLKDYVTMLASWYSQGLIYKDFMAEDVAPTISFSQAAYAELFNDNVGVAMLAVDDFADIADRSAIVMAGMADITKNEGDALGINDLESAVSPGWYITGSCDMEILPYICRWIDYLYTDEGAIINSYGLESQAWDYDDNGNIAFNDLMVNNPDELSWKILLTLYAVDTGPGYFLYSRNTDTRNETQRSAVEAWYSNQDGSLAYPTNAVMSQDEQSEYGNYITEIDTYTKGMILKWIVGEGDIEAEWDTYLATVGQLGIENVIAVKQAAYDRYMELVG